MGYSSLRLPRGLGQPIRRLAEAGQIHQAAVRHHRARFTMRIQRQPLVNRLRHCCVWNRLVRCQLRRLISPPPSQKHVFSPDTVKT